MTKHYFGFESRGVSAKNYFGRIVSSQKGWRTGHFSVKKLATVTGYFSIMQSNEDYITFMQEMKGDVVVMNRDKAGKFSRRFAHF